MSPGAKKEIDAAKVTIMGLLLAGNIFFVNRLVDKVDRTADEVGDMRLELVEVKGELAGIGRIMKRRSGYKDAAYCREEPVLKSPKMATYF